MHKDARSTIGASPGRTSGVGSPASSAMVGSRSTCGAGVSRAFPEENGSVFQSENAAACFSLRFWPHDEGQPYNPR